MRRWFVELEKHKKAKAGPKAVSRKAAKTQREATSHFYETPWLKAIRDSNDPVFDQVLVKVDEKAELHAGQFQVRQELFHVNRQNGLHRFQLKDNLVLYDYIGFETDIQPNALIDRRDTDLA